MVTSIALRKGTNWTSGFLLSAIEASLIDMPYRLDHLRRSRRPTRLSSYHVLYMEDPTKQARHRRFRKPRGPSHISHHQHRRPPRTYFSRWG